MHTLAAQVIARVETDRSTWTRWNVLAEVERACRGLHLATPADRDRIVQRIQGLATGPHLSIRIAAPHLVDECPPLARSSEQVRAVRTEVSRVSGRLTSHRSRGHKRVLHRGPRTVHAGVHSCYLDATLLGPAGHCGRGPGCRLTPWRMRVVAV